ncbi:hypothetical protein M514_13762, partial [Trichuris suis]
MAVRVGLYRELAAIECTSSNFGAREDFFEYDRRQGEERNSYRKKLTQAAGKSNAEVKLQVCPLKEET